MKRTTELFTKSITQRIKIVKKTTISTQSQILTLPKPEMILNKDPNVPPDFDTGTP